MRRKMQNKILQGSEEWKAARKSKIGASEVFTLVAHYCRKELEAMGFDLVKERPFRTIQELFLKIKFGAELSEIDPAFAEFGNGMEEYIAERLYHHPDMQEAEICVIRSKEFITNENLHPLAACSPDGYLSFDPAGCSIPDFDKTCQIDDNWGRGALEIKTSNFFAGFTADQGAKLQYIFQHQFQMMVMDLKWGIIAVLMPKEKEFDDPFFKGRALENILITQSLKKDSRYSACYDLHYYTYPRLIAFQALILKALKCFQDDLEGYDVDESRFPRNSEDLVGLQREKKMWAQLWPDHYGIRQLVENDDLNKLFNDRYQAQVEMMFAEQNFELLTNQILQKVKQAGLDKYCEILGTENRMSWIKNGQIRFYKINEKNRGKNA